MAERKQSDSFFIAWSPVFCKSTKSPTSTPTTAFLLVRGLKRDLILAGGGRYMAPSFSQRFPCLCPIEKFLAKCGPSTDQGTFRKRMTFPILPLYVLIFHTRARMHAGVFLKSPSVASLGTVTAMPCKIIFSVECFLSVSRRALGVGLGEGRGHSRLEIMKLYFGTRPGPGRKTRLRKRGHQH